MIGRACRKVRHARRSPHAARSRGGASLLLSLGGAGWVAGLAPRRRPPRTRRSRPTEPALRPRSASTGRRWPWTRRALLVVRSHRDEDLVRLERRERVSYCELDVGFASECLHRLAWKLLGRALRSLLGLTECALIVCEPVENSLSDDGHNDLDPVGVANLVPEGSSACSTVLTTRTFGTQDPSRDRHDAKRTGWGRRADLSAPPSGQSLRPPRQPTPATGRQSWGGRGSPRGGRRRTKSKRDAAARAPLTRGRTRDRIEPSPRASREKSRSSSR